MLLDVELGDEVWNISRVGVGIISSVGRGVYKVRDVVGECGVDEADAFGLFVFGNGLVVLG